MAKVIGSGLGLEHFGPIHFYSIFTLGLFLAYFVLSSILSFVFWNSEIVKDGILYFCEKHCCIFFTLIWIKYLKNKHLLSTKSLSESVIVYLFYLFVYLPFIYNWILFLWLKRILKIPKFLIKTNSKMKYISELLTIIPVLK